MTNPINTKQVFEISFNKTIAQTAKIPEYQVKKLVKDYIHRVILGTNRYIVAGRLKYFDLDEGLHGMCIDEGEATSLQIAAYEFLEELKKV